MKLTKDRKTPLQREIDKLMEGLENITDTKEYSKKLALIERLNELRDDKKSRERINPNTIINVAGSLIGIAAVLTYETIYNGVITSKALGFILKSRV